MKKTVEQAVITKNGFGLDIIKIYRFDADTAFPSINRGSNIAQLPSETAELFLAEQKIIYGIDHIEIINNKPITIANKQGFSLHYKLANKKGLQYEYLSKGFITKDSFYVFIYRAPTIHYFQASLSSFNQIVASILLNESIRG